MRSWFALLVMPWAAAAATAQVFSAAGPDAVYYGQSEGYPKCAALTYLGEPRCRVGAFSHFDELFPAHIIAAPVAPSPLHRAANPLPIAYTHDGKARNLDDYLSRRAVTGFLVARGDTILVERYQYARNDRHRLTSFSMAKTITAIAVGLAVRDGAIRSVDDRAETYVPELQGTEFGRTPIRALLRMASGVAFDENYADNTSDIYRLALKSLGPDGNSLAAIRQFDRRAAPAGARFSYSSADTLVLGLVLTHALKRPIADYLAQQLWSPLGAEADASWIVDGAGQEVTYAYFNAVLRDWARLGLMMAHGGKWNGRQVVPTEWVGHMTAQGASPGFGWQLWRVATRRPTYQFRGLRGQFVFFDPQSMTVLVHTALRDGGADDAELMSIWRSLIGEQ